MIVGVCDVFLPFPFVTKEERDETKEHDTGPDTYAGDRSFPEARRCAAAAHARLRGGAAALAEATRGHLPGYPCAAAQQRRQ
jgi:hypothetical protein